MRVASPKYVKPDWEETILYSEVNGDKTYIKTILGVMTSDYYVEDEDGNIIMLRDTIDDNAARKIIETSKIATGSNANEYNVGNSRLKGITNEVIDSYRREHLEFQNIEPVKDYLEIEKIDGKEKLLRFIEFDVTKGGYSELKILVIDVNTGEEIPYEKILEQYQ